MGQGFRPWISNNRLTRFLSVGVIATLVHAGILALLQTGLGLPRGEANLIGFVVAFIFSMAGQQRFTFNDRLQGKHLNAFGLLILFVVNATAAFGLGSLAKGGLVILLPLLPAVINYVLLYMFSGNSLFRS
jgi:putative flippase GtrA